MTIKTGRTDENGRITIDYSRCKACGTCVVVCKDSSIKIENGKLIVSDTPFFGCIACGQCVAVCPNDAIMVEGRTVSRSNFVPIPKPDNRAKYEELYNLMVARRSVRDFKDQEVEEEIINKIIEAASTAPMGIPPSDVGVFVFKGKDKVKKFSFDFLKFAKTKRWLFSKPMLLVWRLMAGKATYEAFKTFVVPLYDGLISEMEKGEDWLLYNAPLAMYFYNSSFADSADPIIAATYATLAAESIGLGCCMIGSIAPMMKSAKELKKRYGIPQNARDGIVLIFGYPKFKYRKAVKRTFAGVNRY